MKRRTLLVAALAFTGCTDAAAPPRAMDPSQLSVKAVAAGGPTSLPSFGGNAVAEAINDFGVIVGVASEPDRSRTEAGISYPAKWTRNAAGAWGVASLGTAGGRALALNEVGDAVGVGSGQAIVWPATGGEVQLGVGVAEGINGERIIVGSSVWGGAVNSVAYVWIPSTGTPTTWTRQELPLLEAGGSADAIAINENSVIAGAATRGGVPRAVVWMPVAGGWSTPIPREGTDASTGSSAGFGLNDNGDVVGYARTCPPQTCNGRPYLWPAIGGSIDLGNLNSMVNSGRSSGIGNDGNVAGWVTVIRGNSGGPFIWHPGGTSLIDLGDGEARGINNGNPQYGQEAVGFRRTTKGQIAVVWQVP